MPRVVVPREDAELIERQTLTRLAIREKERSKPPPAIDIWAEKNFFVASTTKPIVLEDFQRGILRLPFTRDAKTGRFPFSTVVYSTVKKTGKTTLAAVVGRWFAETQTRFGEIYTMGNDMRQSKGRSFEHIKQSIQLTPGYRHRGNEGVLSDRWLCQTYRMDCLTSGTKIEAVSVDAAGEAGGNQDLTIWTELWGFETREAIDFFNEMTPVPTKESIRLVETYAGFEGQSELLRGIHDDGKESGRQMTAGEFAERTDTPLGAWEESPNEDDLIPVWVNEETGLFMWWDSGLQARRMPWQRGETGEKYYREQASHLPPPQMKRLHHNEWVGGEGEFISMQEWDACYDPNLGPLEDDDRTACVLAVDAATTGDCFGIVLLTRHPEQRTKPAVRHVRCWYPPKGGKIDLDVPEAFIRTVTQGGCAKGHPEKWRKEPEECDHARPEVYACSKCCEACRNNILVPKRNVLEVTYDPFQLEQMMTRLYKEGVNTQPFDQGALRAIADSNLYKMIGSRGMAHRGQPALREHVQNAGSKLSKEEDSKMRIIKRVEYKKIDLCVATSMGCNRILYYNL